MGKEAGTRVTSAAARGKNGHSLISNAKFRQLYELALRLQRACGRDQRLRSREAAIAGVAADLRDNDVVVAEHVASLGDIAKGQIAVRMSQRNFEERVIEALSDAVGDRMRKTGRITAIFFDATQSSVMREARSLAIAAKLPVLFVEHLSTSPRGNASKKKEKNPTALEYPSIPVDTQDVIAMYRVAHESIERARDNGGPTHLVSVRWQPLATKGRDAEAEANNQDSVEHLEEWLRARGLPAQEWRREILAELEANPIETARHSQDQAFAAQNPPSQTKDEDTEVRAIA